MVNHCKFPFLRTSWRSFKGMLKSMPSALGIRWSLAAVPGCVGAEWPAAVGAGCSFLQHLGEFEWEKCLRLAEFSEIGKLPFCKSVSFRRFGFWDLEMNSSRCSDVPNLCLNPSSWHILTYFFLSKLCSLNHFFKQSLDIRFYPGSAWTASFSLFALRAAHFGPDALSASATVLSCCQSSMWPWVSRHLLCVPVDYGVNIGKW